jgi:uncharacterized membrane protein
VVARLVGPARRTPHFDFDRGNVWIADDFDELPEDLQWLPARSTVVAVSGLADIAVGVLVAVPATRRTGAWATAALITTYLPAHLEPLRHRRAAQRAFDRPAGDAARVVVNLGYIAWAAAVARRATGRPRTG